MNYLSGPAFSALGPEERRFIELYLDQGLPKTVAYKEAYGTTDGHRASVVLQRPDIQAAIAERGERHVELFQVQRNEVIQGLKDAVDMARMLSEPMTMVAAWREIARMCGYYEAQKHKIEVNVSGNLTVQRIQQMTDDELMKLAAQSADALEGEFTKVTPPSE